VRRSRISGSTSATSAAVRRPVRRITVRNWSSAARQPRHPSRCFSIRLRWSSLTSPSRYVVTMSTSSMHLSSSGGESLSVVITTAWAPGPEGTWPGSRSTSCSTASRPQDRSGAAGHALRAGVQGARLHLGAVGPGVGRTLTGGLAGRPRLGRSGRRGGASRRGPSPSRHACRCSPPHAREGTFSGLTSEIR
jgi:hypothetical protein